MIISYEDLGEIFDKIHHVWIQTHTPVVILCAADCDSICTTKILTSLLATEMISYTIQPVLSYEHIAKYNDNTLLRQLQTSELHTIIMINCGAIVDLNNLLFIRPFINKYQQENINNNNMNDDSDFEDDNNNEEKLNEYVNTQLDTIDNNFNIYVIDSHRPFNLSNVYDDQRVHLLQGIDGQQMQEFPKLIEDLDMENSNNNNNNNNNDDDDDDFEIDDDDFMSSDDDFDLNDNNNTNEPLKKKRKLNNKSSNNNNINGELIRLQRSQDEYYKYEYYALNSSNILYLMARKIQKDDNNMLWLGILGLTESFIYEKIDRDKYNECVSYYCDEVKRRNKTNSYKENEVSYNFGIDSVDSSCIISHREMDHIQFSTEFRFILMRFWTLYDSMYYSRYISTQLGVWKQKGKDELKYLLAKMALPLNEAKQPYNQMKREYKKKLPQLFREKLNCFNFDNLTFGSFTKQHGSHQSISASDMVYAITAVLESDFKIDNKGHIDIDIDIDDNKDNNENNEDIFFDNNAWQSNFFYGYDTLNVNKQNLLRVAISLAKKRQEEIVEMGIRLMEKRCIKTIGITRYCCIDNTNNSMNSNNKFQSPMLLCKLGLFIMDAYRAQTNKKSKHFILASYNDKLNNYTVVGIPAKKYIGDVNRSPFYTSFEEARKRVNANAKIVFFEGHVIQIHKDHFTDWLENLHERLLNYAY